MSNFTDKFLGFTFNGQSSSNFNFYCVSSSGYYTTNLIPTFNDKTQEMTRTEGSVLLSTFHKEKTITFNIAYDNLTLYQLDAMRRWLNVDSPKQLKLNGDTKYYNAMISTPPQLKYICFKENNTYIYRGEGTITFTCYDPYAYALQASASGKNDGELPIYFIITAGTTSQTWTANTTITVSPCVYNGNYTGQIKIPSCTGQIVWDSKLGLVKLYTDATTYTILDCTGDLFAQLKVSDTDISTVISGTDDIDSSISFTKRYY